MVNNLRNVPWTPSPTPLPKDRSINGPRYSLKVVQALVTGDDIYQATESVEEDLLKLGFDTDDVARLLQALTDLDYRQSEWCETTNGMTIDSDVYVIRYDHVERIRDWHKPEYYVKFGFRNNRAILLLVSCHLSRNK